MCAHTQAITQVYDPGSHIRSIGFLVPNTHIGKKRAIGFRRGHTSGVRERERERESTMSYDSSDITWVGFKDKSGP